MSVVNLYRLHPTQRKIEAEASRFNVVVSGRRFGKSLMGKNKAAEVALDGFPVGWFSPEYKYLLEEWRDLNDILHPVISRANISEKRIELVTGGVVEFWAVDTPDVARGRKYKAVIIDEAAIIRHLKHAWENAIRPTLTDYGGGAWFFSTPKGRNYFWELYQRGQDPLSDVWASWQYPTLANPYIDPAEIEQARHDLPYLAFQQEYEAAFLEGEGAVFRRVQDGATAPDDQKPQDHGGHHIYFGVDWGKQNDFTCIVGLCRECKQVVLIDRFNQIDYVFQTRRLMSHVHRWKPQGVMPERNSMGDPLIDLLRAEQGISIMSGPDGKPGYFVSSTTKHGLIEDLALAIEKGDLTYPNDPVLIGELLAYDRKPSVTGRATYGAPEGMHDDCVMALALAHNAAGTGGVNLYTMEW